MHEGPGGELNDCPFSRPRGGVSAVSTSWWAQSAPHGFLGSVTVTVTVCVGPVTVVVGPVTVVVGPVTVVVGPVTVCVFVTVCAGAVTVWVGPGVVAISRRRNKVVAA